jgi:hypothetical protein
MKLVQFDFPYNGPFGPEMTAAMDGLAKSIAQEPGFIWKIWTENQSAHEAGGIYVFSDEQSARNYIKNTRSVSRDSASKTSTPKYST